MGGVTFLDERLFHPGVLGAVSGGRNGRNYAQPPDLLHAGIRVGQGQPVGLGHPLMRADHGCNLILYFLLDLCKGKRWKSYVL